MRALLPLLLFFAAGGFAAAQTTTTSIFRFLEVSPTAQAAGLGGNQVGLYNADFSLMQLNPAYQHSEYSGAVSASYLNFLADANMGFTNGAYTIEHLGTFGLGIRFMGYGEMSRLDENGNNLGTFNANDLALTGTYSHSLTPNLNAGVGLNFIHSSYAEFKSSAIALSGGLFYKDTTAHFSAGLAVRNVGGQLTAFVDQRERLPLDVSLGFTKKPEAFPFRLSLTFKQLNNWDMRIFGEKEHPKLAENIFLHILFGGEAAMGKSLKVRFGYDHFLHEQTKSGKSIDLAGVAFGLGFQVKTIIIDISRNSYSSLGGLTRISIKTAL
jgi:hypothetical protein